MSARPDRLVPYIRQSKRKERTISLDDQRHDNERWAKQNNVALLPEIVEQGVSGNKSWRERGLGQAIDMCRRGEAEGIIVAWQDRLSRENGLATAEVWDALDRAKLRLVVANEGLDTATGDHELTFAIRAAIARDNWKRYRANFDHATTNAIENGWHMGRSPFGYTKGEDRILIIVPDEVKIVCEIFQARIEGKSIRSLAKRFKMSETGIRTIISNRVYLGEVHHGEKVKLDAHEPIIDLLTFDLANAVNRQDVAIGRTGSPAKETLSAGFARCAICGNVMLVNKTTPRGKSQKQYLNLVCHNPLCESPRMNTISVKKVDGELVSRLMFLQSKFRRGLIYIPGIDPKVIEDAEKGLASAKHDLDTYNDVEILQTIGKEKFIQKVSEYTERVEQAQERLRSLKDEDKKGSVTSLSEAWNKWSMEERRSRVERMVESIRIHPTGTEPRIEIKFSRPVRNERDRERSMMRQEREQ